MEYDNINMSNVEEVIEQTVKKQLETLIRIEHDQYLEEKVIGFIVIKNQSIHCI